jgi:hypothetical protein
MLVALNFYLVTLYVCVDVPQADAFSPCHGSQKAFSKRAPRKTVTFKPMAFKSQIGRTGLRSFEIQRLGQVKNKDVTSNNFRTNEVGVLGHKPNLNLI